MQQTIKHGDNELVFNHTPADHPTGVIFCGGFNSSRNGHKALALEALCANQNVPYTRFDYSGHGDSGGEFADGSIDSWLADTLCVFDHIATSTKQIVIGSSMGAWIATLVAQQRPQRLAGLVTIAAAADFTERLIAQHLSAEQQGRLEAQGYFLRPSQYDDGSPYPITQRLIDESRRHCVLGSNVKLDVPVRLLHGTNDTQVPHQLSLELLETIDAADAQLTLIKGGDHRMSDPLHLQILEQTLLPLF